LKVTETVYFKTNYITKVSTGTGTCGSSFSLRFEFIVTIKKKTILVLFI
jgi:hypothetical protein